MDVAVVGMQDNTATRQRFPAIDLESPPTTVTLMSWSSLREAANRILTPAHDRAASVATVGTSVAIPPDVSRDERETMPPAPCDESPQDQAFLAMLASESRLRARIASLESELELLARGTS